VNSWDPALYLKFSGERTQPAVDLAARIRIDNPRRVIDLGCGPGNSTQVLRARFPDVDVEGLDGDAGMIAEARRAFPERRWIQGDIASWTPAEPYDVIFSNAALHWIPGHDELLPRLLSHAQVLAVQMPAHHASPVHREILNVSQDPRWSARLDPARNALTRHPPEYYYDLLAPRVELWETEYIHILESPAAIIEWFRSTGLRPFLAELTLDERAAFEAELLVRYERAYPRRPDGRVLFPFRRLFFIAYASRGLK
jgi:trans-aconitate 2-methyltransferase